MKTTPTNVEFARLPKDYSGLCRILTPRPIHDQAEFDNGVEITDIMAGHTMSAADLARLLEVHRTMGAMILRGERRLTLDHVRILAKHFSVSADLFLS